MSKAAIQPNISLDRIGNAVGNRVVKNGGDKEAFAKALNSVTGVNPKLPLAAPELAPLKFSNHAVSRMQQRGLRFEPMELAKIEQAVDKARAKGAKETLVLSDKAAMVVSVKNNTVVTVMDKSTMKDNVFTKIDSTVMI